MYGFSKKQRLLNQFEFKQTFNEAKRISNRKFVLLYRPNDKNQARLGIVVSKKVVSKACSRNLLKRTIRESFRLNQKLPSVDLIVLPHKNLRFNLPDSNQLRASVDELWDLLSTRFMK